MPVHQPRDLVASQPAAGRKPRPAHISPICMPELTVPKTAAAIPIGGYLEATTRSHHPG